jgi:hypothetical protein
LGAEEQVVHGPHPRALQRGGGLERVGEQPGEKRRQSDRARPPAGREQLVPVGTPWCWMTNVCVSCATFHLASRVAPTMQWSTPNACTRRGAGCRSTSRGSAGRNRVPDRRPSARAGPGRAPGRSCRPRRPVPGRRPHRTAGPATPVGYCSRGSRRSATGTTPGSTRTLAGSRPRPGFGRDVRPAS